MRTIEIKMGCHNFHITFIRRRKTSTCCNGKGWIYIDEGKDGCNDCGDSGDLLAQLDNVILGGGNIFTLNKGDILSKGDFEKLALAADVYYLKNRIYEESGADIEAIRPKFFYKGKEVRDARQFTS